MELSNSLGVLPAPDAVPAHEEIYAAAAQTKDVQVCNLVLSTGFIGNSVLR